MDVLVVFKTQGLLDSFYTSPNNLYQLEKIQTLFFTKPDN